MSAVARAVMKALAVAGVVIYIFVMFFGFTLA